MYVIEQPILPAHAADFAANMLAEWNAVYDAYNEVACLMLGKKGKPVAAYVLKMKGYVGQLERLGYVLPQDLSVGLILNGLTSDFAGFVGNYNMHNMGKTIGELHAMLIEYEKGLLKKAKTPQVMAIRGGKIQKANKKSLKAKGKGKANGKEKDKQVYIPKPKNPKPYTKEHPAKDDTCHHCKEVGHWKRNCPVYLAELLKKKKQVGTASSSGARKPEQGALYLYVGNGFRAQVEAIGSFDLVLPNGLVICLDNCHYAPTITRGVVSVHHLVENGFVQCFTNYGILVSKNDVLYFNDIPRNGIYEIDMHNLVPNVNSIYNVSNKRAKHNLDSTYLWHCRLAHISKKRIEKLQHEGLLKSTDDESFDQCVSCLSGKMTRKPFSHRTERATDLLGIIHTDVCGPLRHVSRQGASYFITFTDDYSRYGYVYLLKHKHEVFETFKVFKNEVENQLGKTIKALRSDRGGEYISQEFKDYLKACGIVQQLTPPYTPQHNGVSERRNRTLLDMVRSMMNLTTLSLSFWDYALESATRILNMVPTKKVDKTPYELWYGKVPNLSYLKETMGYYFYFPPENKIVVARYAEFFEKSLITQEVSGRAIDLEEIQDEDTSPSKITSKIPMEVEGFEPPQEEVIPILDLPLNCKTVGSKWIFKKKTDMDGMTDMDGIVKAIDFGHSQMSYMDKIIEEYRKEVNSKRGHIPMQERLYLNKTQGASTPEEVKRMQSVPYASVAGSIMYSVRCTRPDVAFAQNITSPFQQILVNLIGLEAEYIAASEAVMEAVWIRKFIQGLVLVPTINEPDKGMVLGEYNPAALLMLTTGEFVSLQQLKNDATGPLVELIRCVYGRTGKLM
ncbi:retrotransposon protein, putative, ty1-copia subclass [Tanacetum coccineum]